LNGFRRGRPGLGAVALLLAACASVPPRAAGPPPAEAAQAGLGSIDRSDAALDMMIEKYGRPDGVEGARFVWNRRGVWSRIEVRDRLDSNDGDAAANDIEETIAYPVPAARIADLAAFSGGLRASSDGKELSSRSPGRTGTS
jgi:hypothetical protein